MSNYKVYISDYDYGDNDIEKSILEPIGAEVIGLQCKTGEGLGELAKDADAILQQYAKIPASTIHQLQHCKIIARYGIGVDILDVRAAKEQGILVTNVPDYCIDEVADHAISMSFMLLRNLPFYDRKIHQGSYQWQDWRVPLLRYRGAVYGLLGFGRIAQNLTYKLHAFGFKVIAYDPFLSESLMRSHGVEKVDLMDLFSLSDIVNILAPYNDKTHHIVQKATLSVMKPGSYLVGVSRGKCIDNQALYDALTNGTLAGAALDDPEEEPMKQEHWTPDANPLFTLDNCFFTPHTAYATKQSLEECRRIAATNVKMALLGQTPPDLIRG
jgi:D-3-phosphoglycerate dehydrogenase